MKLYICAVNLKFPIRLLLVHSLADRFHILKLLKKKISVYLVRKT